MAKKIGAIASLSIIGLLIIATIIMANIKIDFSVNCPTPNNVWVIYNNGYVEASSIQSEEIVKLINNASKENSLSALFNGNFGKKAEIKAVSGTKTIPSNSNFYVEFAYHNAQDLMLGNEKYEDTDGNTYTYERLIFTVTSSKETSLVNVYIIEDSSAPTTYTHYYELEANLYDLYNYLVENNFNS